MYPFCFVFLFVQNSMYYLDSLQSKRHWTTSTISLSRIQKACAIYSTLICSELMLWNLNEIEILTACVIWQYLFRFVVVLLLLYDGRLCCGQRWDFTCLYWSDICDVADHRWVLRAFT